MSLVITVDGVDYTVPSGASDTNWAAQQVAFEQALATAVNTAIVGGDLPLASISDKGLIGTAGDIDPQVLSGRKEMVIGVQGIYFSPGNSNPAPVAGTTITVLPTTSTIEVDVSGGSVTMTATPTFTTAGIDDGAEILVYNPDPTNDFIIHADSDLSGTKLMLTANTLTLKNNGNVRLRFLGGLWTQVGGCPTLV